MSICTILWICFRKTSFENQDCLFVKRLPYPQGNYYTIPHSNENILFCNLFSHKFERWAKYKTIFVFIFLIKSNTQFYRTAINVCLKPESELKTNLNATMESLLINVPQLFLPTWIIFRLNILVNVCVWYGDGDKDRARTSGMLIRMLCKWNVHHHCYY